MRTLLLMRHAKSSWDNPRMSDHERPLNERGRKSAPIMGEWLKAGGLVPDLIVCSDARRTRETASLVGPACGYAADIVTTNALYLASVPEWRGVLKALPDSSRCVLCIGHNSGLEDLLSHVTGQYHEMKTAAMARLELDLPYWEAWHEDEPALREPVSVTYVRDIAREFDLD